MPADGLWEGVDRLLERLTPELAAEHGLGPLAARRLRRRRRRGARQACCGRSAPPGRRALVAPALLKRAREAYDGPLLLVKGPELTARYPDGARRFGDLDLVAGDAEEAQAALLAAGFRLQDRRVATARATTMCAGRTTTSTRSSGPASVSGSRFTST